ncbi:MAG: ribosome silencing factor [Gammaproteobacteria bacterium]
MSNTQEKEIIELIMATLEDLQAIDIVDLDVRQLTTVTDHMIICSGRSTRHVKAIAQRLIENLKAQAHQPASIAGLPASEWVLVDANDAVVHIMLPEVRDYYSLEKLWVSGEDVAHEA